VSENIIIPKTEEAKTEEPKAKRPEAIIEITTDGIMTLTMDLKVVSPALAHGSIYMTHQHLNAWYAYQQQAAQQKKIVKPSSFGDNLRSFLRKK